jgi:hypothetical protein
MALDMPLIPSKRHNGSAFNAEGVREPTIT